MNKRLGYGDEYTEADILCVGEKKNISLGIVIECKNFKFLKVGEEIPYYGRITTRETLIRSLKKKRIDAFSSCALDQVTVLGVFNEENLDLQQIERGIYIVGCSVFFPKISFEVPQNTPELTLAWKSLTEGMKALPSDHNVIKSVKKLPLHPWFRSNRDYPLGLIDYEVSMPEIAPIQKNGSSAKSVGELWFG